MFNSQICIELKTLIDSHRQENTVLNMINSFNKLAKELPQEQAQQNEFLKVLKQYYQAKSTYSLKIQSISNEINNPSYHLLSLIKSYLKDEGAFNQSELLFFENSINILQIKLDSQTDQCQNIINLVEQESLTFKKLEKQFTYIDSLAHKQNYQNSSNLERQLFGEESLLNEAVGALTQASSTEIVRNINKERQSYNQFLEEKKNFLADSRISFNITLKDFFLSYLTKNQKIFNLLLEAYIKILDDQEDLSEIEKSLSKEIDLLSPKENAFSISFSDKLKKPLKSNENLVIDLQKKIFNNMNPNSTPTSHSNCKDQENKNLNINCQFDSAKAFSRSFHYNSRPLSPKIIKQFFFV